MSPSMVRRHVITLVEHNRAGMGAPLAHRHGGRRECSQGAARMLELGHLGDVIVERTIL